MKISVVIPYFRKKNYIERTLISIINQTYENFECIVIDDGSDFDEYLEQTKLIFDGRFRFVFKENGGVAETRNIGLASSVGDCILFLDADDTIHDRLLENASNLFEDVGFDVFQYKTEIYDEVRKRKIPFKFRWKTYSDCFEDALANWDVDLIIPIHSRIYNRDFLIRNNINFDSNLKNKEDWDFILQVNSANPKISCLDYVGCTYFSGIENNRSSELETIRIGLVQLYKKWGDLNRNEVNYNKSYRFLSMLFTHRVYVGEMVNVSTLANSPEIIFRKILNCIRGLNIVGKVSKSQSPDGLI